MDSDYQLPNNLILNQPLDISNIITGDSGFQIWNYNSPLGNNLSGFKLGGNQFQINGIPQFISPSFQVNTNASGGITSLPEVFFSYITNSSVFRLDYATNQVLTKYNTLDDGAGNLNIAGSLSAFNALKLTNFSSSTPNESDFYFDSNTGSTAVNGQKYYFSRINHNTYTLDFKFNCFDGTNYFNVLSSDYPTGFVFLGDAGHFNVKILGQLQLTTGATGSGSASLSTNCPATTPSAPYTWLKMIAPDGSTVYVPAWK